MQLSQQIKETAAGYQVMALYGFQHLRVQSVLRPCTCILL